PTLPKQRRATLKAVQESPQRTDPCSPQRRATLGGNTQTQVNGTRVERCARRHKTIPLPMNPLLGTKNPPVRPRACPGHRALGLNAGFRAVPRYWLSPRLKTLLRPEQGYRKSPRRCCRWPRQKAAYKTGTASGVGNENPGCNRWFERVRNRSARGVGTVMGTGNALLPSHGIRSFLLYTNAAAP